MRIPIYYVEDLTLADIDKLIERGVCFDITSKTTLLPKDSSTLQGDHFWSDGVELPGSV